MAQAPAGPARTVPADGDYRIGIEDVLRISVWGEPNLGLSTKVRPDGKITVPLANDVKVDGLTPEEVRQEITAKLSAYLREPLVTVMVEQINSFRIYVLGEVSGQGAITLFRPTRILQAIALAGGVTQFAKREILVVREVNRVEQRIRVDYKRLLSGDPSQENIFLRPGDLILVN
jgi:polysaccharide biosynthesis/export protein